MRIVYFGSGAFALKPLQALFDHGEEIVAVVTQPDKPAGRGGRMTAPPVKELSTELGLPIMQPVSCRSTEFLDALRDLSPDLIVVAAYGQFLPDSLLLMPSRGAVNLHGSLLPRYRGAAPIQRSLWNGEKETGVCLMWMVREMDAGDVIDCRSLTIMSEDTTGSLTEKLAELGADLLIHWLPSLEAGAAPRRPQSPDEVTFAPMIRKEERVIDWNQSAEAIWRQVRALSPSPAATTIFRGELMKVHDVCPISTNDCAVEGKSGTIMEVSVKDEVLVATGCGLLRLRIVQPAGKRPMSDADFRRGYRVVVGEVLGAD